MRVKDDFEVVVWFRFKYRCRKSGLDPISLFSEKLYEN